MYHICIRSSVSRRLGRLHVSAAMNSASMNIEMHVSFWIIVLSLMKVAIHFFYTLPLAFNLKNLPDKKEFQFSDSVYFSPQFPGLLHFVSGGGGSFSFSYGTGLVLMNFGFCFSGKVFASSCLDDSFAE